MTVIRICARCSHTLWFGDYCQCNACGEVFCGDCINDHECDSGNGEEAEDDTDEDE